ncbi:hypothetical protein CA982_26100 [Gordonia lacunae]|uniref:Uncharacterized protein n=1 Tax=Gordonia lacunae TaxID=417102 RepID=A0A243Q2M1_9ACTN|nr:hypothetical protein CA982_26100 [Gordonia lacunae]
MPERTPPNWWQPPTPPDLDTPDFRNPPDPDYTQPPTDQPDLADWLAAVIASITPPTPVEPEGEDGAPSDEQLRDQFEEVIQEIADAATAAVGLQALSDGPLNAQRFGTEVHTLFKELMQLYLETNLDQWFGPDFILNLEESFIKASGLKRDNDTGRYEWDPYGSAGSARPDVVITRLVTDTAGNAIETVFLILDVKTGNADISNTWRDAVSRATDSAADIIRSIKPGVPRVLSRPPSTTTPPP